MPNYVKPQTPLYSKENEAYFYPLTTSDQVIMPDGSRLTPDKLEAMILETATPDAIGALSMELLWENASPDSAFDEHTGNSAITFQEGDGAYLIEFYGMGSATASETKKEFPNKVSTLLCLFISEDKQALAGSRKVSPTNKSIAFDSGIYSTNGIAEVGTTNNGVCKPLRIWRLRGV